LAQGNQAACQVGKTINIVDIYGVSPNAAPLAHGFPAAAQKGSTDVIA
jgi:hypothetical protein